MKERRLPVCLSGRKEPWDNADSPSLQPLRRNVSPADGLGQFPLLVRSAHHLQHPVAVHSRSGFLRRLRRWGRLRLGCRCRLRRDGGFFRHRLWRRSGCGNRGSRRTFWCGFFDGRAGANRQFQFGSRGGHFRLGQLGRNQCCQRRFRLRLDGGDGIRSHLSADATQGNRAFGAYHTRFNDDLGTLRFTHVEATILLHDAASANFRMIGSHQDFLSLGIYGRGVVFHQHSATCRTILTAASLACCRLFPDAGTVEIHHSDLAMGGKTALQLTFLQTELFGLRSRPDRLRGAGTQQQAGKRCRDQAEKRGAHEKVLHEGVRTESRLSHLARKNPQSLSLPQQAD